ncbi:LysE/ArgO family amino acid transporter [Aidingimonas halophila]|nr:LysE family transporter [Aidingimonas halophila]GHC30185.1 transporter [Aidingimonas halophila]
MLASAVHGLMVGGGLIVAIGAQNAFVLSQGLRREHAWWVAAICAICDWLLVGLGVLGMGALIAEQDWMMALARWGGTVFLAWQSALAFRRAMTPHALAPEAKLMGGRRRVLLAAFAVTLLNPQVYLETLIMLGAIGAVQHSPVGFFLGAALASFVWFFGLVAAAGWLASRLTRPWAWRVIDSVIGIMLAAIAWRLAAGAMLP